jgi:cystathionine beta-lyase/cystathionine gamma-synthase
MSEKRQGLETRLIHAGATRPRIGGAAVTPIFQSSVFEQPQGAGYDEILYPRLSTLPNHTVIGARLASLEEGETALVTASGMAAISAALLASLADGGHLLVQDQLYGGTHSFVTEDLPRLGVSYDFIDAQDPASWRAKLKPTSRAIYVESMTNPLVQIADHRAVAAFAREHGLASLIDNTFATPVNFRPIEHGFDVVLHSATKYLNGHSDLAAGAVVGSRDRVRKVHHLLNHLGGSLDPHACFLLERGLKTLALRVRAQNANAQRLAEFLAGHPAVKRVNYPGLEQHPQHARARTLFQGCSGMLSFELENGQAAVDWIARTRLAIHAPSLGGMETLVTRPVATSHAGMSAEERRRVGIGDGLIRVSVGLESIEDVVDDFAQAFDPRRTGPVPRERSNEK